MPQDRRLANQVVKADPSRTCASAPDPPASFFPASSGRVIVGLVAALVLVVTPGAALASEGAHNERATASPAGDNLGVQAERVGTVGKTWLGDTNAGQPVYRAWAEFTVYWNHAKTLWVCDRYNGDGIGLAIEVGPTGGGPPDTLIYYDENGAAGGCLDHAIGYSVRKWRFISVYQNGRIHDNNHAWQTWPLPRNDF